MLFVEPVPEADHAALARVGADAGGGVEAAIPVPANLDMQHLSILLGALGLSSGRVIDVRVVGWESRRLMAFLTRSRCCDAFRPLRCAIWCHALLVARLWPRVHAGRFLWTVVNER